MSSTWRGYEGGPHVLNNELLDALSVSIRGPDDAEPRKMTLLQTVRWCAGKVSKDSLVTNRTALVIDAASGRYTIEGGEFCRYFLRALLSLQAQGVEDADLLTSQWFYYGRDETVAAPTKAHHFFVVSNDRIAETKATLYEYESSDFRPDVLTSLKELLVKYPPIWVSDRTEPEALARLWYRRFYEQTIAGQMMVVNPTQPELFHYTRFTAHDTGTAVLAHLARIGRTLEWLVVGVAAIVVLLVIRLLR